MKKRDKPSDYFVGAILRAFNRAQAERGTVTCSKLWDYVVMECFRRRDGFKIMFEWDTSKAQSKNRIHTIAECIRRGHVPGLQVNDRLEVIENE